MRKNSTIARALRPLVLAAAVLAVAAPVNQVVAAQWNSSERVHGSGKIVSQTRQVGHFNGLSLSLPARLKLRIGNTEGVTIETDDNILPLIETVIEDGTLKIRASERNQNFKTERLRIVVHAKSVSRVALGGSGSIEADALRAAKLQFNLGGSGEIRVREIESDELTVSVGGSGDLSTGGGAARRMTVSIGGSGDVDLGRVRAETASVNVAGSGGATVWVRDQLNVSVAGSGDVNYYGDPRVSKSVFGSGGANRLAASPR